MSDAPAGSGTDLEQHIFRELNEHMRATEQKHLQVSVAYLGAMALALSLLAPSASVNTARTLFHTWGHLLAYFVMVMAGCATILAQHSYRGWKKHYLIACKRLVARWPLDSVEGLTWLRLDIGPYSHFGPYQTPVRTGLFKVSGDNGLYYFTIAVTSSLVVVLLISLVTFIGGAVGIAVAAVSGLCYFAFLFRINIAGIVRKRIAEQEWRDFRLTVLTDRGIADDEIDPPLQFARPTAEDRDLGRDNSQVRLCRVDLRNHTHYSHNSSIHADDYVRAHADGAFDVLGITDRNTIRGALELRELVDFPIVIGEEVDTIDGPVIGLFLERPLTPGQTALDTAKEIRSQGGLVYLQHSVAHLPHRGLARATQEKLFASGQVDIAELSSNKVKPRQKAFDHGVKAVATASNACFPPDIGRCYAVTSDGGIFDGTPRAADLLVSLEHGSLVFDRRSSLSRFASRSHFELLGAMTRIAGVSTWSGRQDR